MAVPSTDFGYRSNPRLEDRLTGSSYDGLLLFGRILMALIFVQSGFGKFLDIGGFTASLASKGVALAGIFGVIGSCVEFFGGLAVLFGLQTRYAAVLIAVFIVVATAISHRYWEFSDAGRRAQEVNFMNIIGGFLVLAAVGGGQVSIDTLWRQKALALWSRTSG